MLSRRALIAGSSAAVFALACAPGLVLAHAPTDRRFVFLVLRGGLDGLEALMPVGDPAFANLGGRQDPLGEPEAIDSFFRLHANLARLAPLACAGELAFVHAVASPYRDRSHFDGQNVIETGGRRAYELKNGWLTRLVTAMQGDASVAVALSANVPVSLHGEIPFGNYPSSRLAMPEDAMAVRLRALWAGDPALSGTWAQVERAARILNGARAGNPAQLAAHFLAHPEGPRIAVLETGGFDTHSSQKYRLGTVLADVERIVLQLKDGLGVHWASTILVAATEFGRTVAMNGAHGTDHGTGGLAIVAGGALAGWGVKGPVVADWPGLRREQLLDGRDLKPTRDLRSLLLAVAARQFALDPARVSPLLFPGPDRVSPDSAFL